MTEVRKRACVVVLGDWGRSPRMQYHAQSLTKNGFTVDVVAYDGSEPHEDIKNNKFISCRYLKEVPKFERVFLRFMVYVLKTLWQSFFLFWTLMRISSPQVMLLQNPPSIPTLPVCWMVCWLRKCHLIVDFHNYGFTILGLAIGEAHVLVKLCAWCEKFFGRRTALNLCVTRAMQKDLSVNWNIRSVVFHDCPPKVFCHITVKEKHYFFMKLSEDYEPFKKGPLAEDDNAECNRFTIKLNEEISLLEGRPPLVISSTSWTEDEDFSLLLDALQEYEESIQEQSDLPDIVVVITGKGPLKRMYEDLIKSKNFHHVQVITPWLPAEDYPVALASADLGISLHKSSSGLDLPMKVVDMFGSGLPVCAVSYSCIDELVKKERNGLLFSTSSELSSQLKLLLKGFPNNAKQLESFRQNLIESPLPRWDERWQNCVLPHLQDMCS